MKRRILYIAGYGRSGSTLLDSLLSNHQHAVGGGELFFVWQYLRDNRPCSCGVPMRECPFWSAVIDRTGFRLGLPSTSLPYQEFEDLRMKIEGSYRSKGDRNKHLRVTSTLVNAILDEANAEVLIDSSKSCRWATHRAELLSDLDEFDFRMIHLVRHPQAVMWSTGRGRNEKMRTADSTRESSAIARNLRMARGIASWTATNRSVERTIRKLHRVSVLRLRYEDIATNPVGTLRKISEFAGISLADVIEKVEQGIPLKVGHGVGGNRMRQKPVAKIKLDDQWAEKLPPAAKALSAVSVPAMRRYGYQFSVSPQVATTDPKISIGSAASRAPVVWHIAGEDAHVRIPSLLALRKLGYDVGVCGSCSEDPFIAAEIPYYRYPVNRFSDPVTDRKSVNALANLMKQHRPDIVHGFSTKPSLFSPQAAAKANLSINVRTVTGMGYLFSVDSLKTAAIRPVYRHLQRRVSRLVDRTVFQNSDDRSYFIQHGLVNSVKTMLIPGSGVAPELFVSTETSRQAINAIRSKLELVGCKVVLMVTRLVRAKGVSDFLKAAVEYQKQYGGSGQKVQFVLIGPLATEGGQAVPLQEIEAAGSAVRYLGRREDVSLFMQMADVFVLPTLYREGIPRVLLEAACASTSIVTTDMPGCREVVEHKKTGLLVPKSDPMAIVESVCTLVNDEELSLQLQAAALKRVHEGFAFEHIVGLYDQLYKTLLDEKRVPAWPKPVDNWSVLDPAPVIQVTER